MTAIACTPFCDRLKTIELKLDILPSHSALVKNLSLSEEDREKGYRLGTHADLVKRRKCPFCRLVSNAIDQNTGDDSDSLDEHEIRILVFPGEESFRISYPSRLGTRLAFVANGATQASGPDNARLVVDGDQSSLVKGWLQACVGNHADCALEPIKKKALENPAPPLRDFNESATSNFRLIDLERGCINHAALDERYVALSYVWGNLPMLMLNTTNFEELSSEGTLESIRSKLPRTINDVIDFVKAMGERYLWIDGLCLVQDDHEDITLGIQMMNSIYHGAYCTIVAASGDDANAGLNPGQDRTQPVEKIAPGLNMTIIHSIDWHFNRSKYKTRGWTLQELVLSRRTIIFIDRKVHFRCRTANWSEDTWAEKWLDWQDPDDSNFTRIPGLMDGLLAHLWPYQKLCEEYSRRVLRRDGDALRATAGIIRSLAAGMQTLLVEGLPGYYLDHFLLFISTKGDLQRRPAFGSFSWAGWNGAVMWPRENFACYNDQSERTWKVDNILKYFKHNRIIQWESLQSRASAYGESLSSSSYRWEDPEAPSPLLRLMREYPDIFDSISTDPLRTRDEPCLNSSFGSHGDTPNWDREPEAGDSINPSDKKRGFTIKGFDLINGQAESDRMVQHIDDIHERLTLRNWQAARSFRVRTAQKGKSRYGPRPLRHEGDAEQFAFREELSIGQSRHDKRRELAERKMDADQVPDFPPYDVLHFKTISFHLALEAMPTQERHRTSPFDRVVGIPLHDKTGELVGSLHPDNFDLLCSQGSSVELLVITKCLEPTVGSALSALENQGPLPWRLLWVMHIVWKQGIAERHGVGQVLASALERSVGPRPQVKRILLG